MAAVKFDVGEVVYLRSGGPAMSVSRNEVSVSGNIFVECIWHNHEGTLSMHRFVQEVLTTNKESHNGH